MGEFQSDFCENLTEFDQISLKIWFISQISASVYGMYGDVILYMPLTSYAALKVNHFKFTNWLCLIPIEWRVEHQQKQSTYMQDSIRGVIIQGLAQAWKVFEIYRVVLKSPWKLNLSWKNTWKTLKGLEKSLNFTIIYRRIQHNFLDLIISV